MKQPALASKKTPTVAFLVDTKGIVRWKHVGAVTDEIIAKELIPALEKAESGK